MLCPTPSLPDDETDEEKKKKYFKLKKFILETMQGIMVELPESDKKIFMQKSPKAMMSKAILGCIMAFAYSLFFLRVYFFNKITWVISFFVAIMSTFVTSTEGEIQKQIKTPNSFIQIATVFKILKACLTVMVLTYNGTINDYFIGAFFFYTALLGQMFFGRAGLFIPKKPYQRSDSDGV